MPITLPIAINKTGHWLHSFSIQLSHPINFSCLFMSAHESTKLSAAMGRLKHFEFNLTYPGYYDERLHRHNKEIQHLDKYLRAIINTETLITLSINLDSYWRTRWGPSFEMRGLLSFRSWPKLYYCHLYGIPIGVQDLKKFIDQIQGPLALFTLSGAHLTDGTWAEALDILRPKSEFYWEVKNPHGAECDDMSEDEIRRIFEAKRDPSPYALGSLAEQYVCRLITYNPLRVEGTQILEAET